MKLKILLITSATSIALASTSQSALVAYWNFNELDISSPDTPGNGDVPTAIAADEGSGSINLTTWTGTIDDFSGSPINTLNGDSAGASLSLIGSGGNGSFIEISFSMTDHQGLALSFATRGTGTGYDQGTWSYSTSGGFIQLLGVNTATTSTTYTNALVDFSDITAVNNAASVTLRYTLNGSTGGNNRIDNLQITAAPEPCTVLLSSLGLLTFLRRRRA